MFKKLTKLNKTHDRKQFMKKNWLILLAVAYFFLPIDLIPDVLPAIGLGDDIAVLLLTGVINLIKNKKKHKKEKIIEGELVND